MSPCTMTPFVLSKIHSSNELAEVETAKIGHSWGLRLAENPEIMRILKFTSKSKKNYAEPLKRQSNESIARRLLKTAKLGASGRAASIRPSHARRDGVEDVEVRADEHPHVDQELGLSRPTRKHDIRFMCANKPTTCMYV